MNGVEFRAIRTFNRVCQFDLAWKVGLSSRQSIYELEKMSAIPQKFLLGLGNIIGADLTDESIVNKMIESIPKKYFSIQKRGKNFGMYANTGLKNSFFK